MSREEIIEALYETCPEFILIICNDTNRANNDVDYEAKGTELRILGAIEKVKARLLRPRIEDL